MIIEPYFFISDDYNNRPLLEKILSDAHSKNARVVALSSQSEEDLITQGLTRGRDYHSYLFKPVNAEDIIQTLKLG
ncbi:hypothetical protein FJZ18_02930 [Candidatus Pacearchaeota archaeon]|nr:hypothetical protein [Candidatus Pacearchaeota archaeon]